MKKFLAILLAAILVLSLAACAGTQKDPSNTDPSNDTSKPALSDEAKNLKVGFIFLHDENSTYDLNFIKAADEACEKLGFDKSQFVYKTNVPEGNECAEAAKDLVNQGCSIIFADSFGHEDYMIEVAKKNPDVQFCHATGTKAHTENLKNYHNAFASIYEGRFLAGVAAGLKLNEMIANGDFKADEAKIGYVGAYTYAEVISGYTSFFLGARSVCESATMDVQFTGSWYDEAAEKEAAQALIAGGCKLISQHADSMGAPTACESAKVPNVSYNGSTVAACPNTFIISSRINWAPYYEYVINSFLEKKEIAADWTGTLKTGSVELSEINDKAAAAGTKEKLEEVKAKLEDGSLEVFDTKTFTVGGKALDADFMADVDTDKDYKVDTKVVEDGAFKESKFRSAPYFGERIDGIVTLNEKF